jgi:hypothetical protein
VRGVGCTAHFTSLACYDYVNTDLQKQTSKLENCHSREVRQWMKVQK